MTRKTFERGEMIEWRPVDEQHWWTADYVKHSPRRGWHIINVAARHVHVPSRRIRKRVK